MEDTYNWTSSGDVAVEVEEGEALEIGGLWG